MSINVQIRAQYEEFISATAQLKEFFGGVMQGMKSELHDMAEQSKADMKASTSVFEDSAQLLKGSMSGITGVVEGVKVAWAQLAVVVGAAAFLKGAVEDTIKLTVEAQNLGRALGISATQASYLKVAIADAHGTESEYLNLSKGLTTQLTRHEERLNAVGLATRDSSGKLKDQSTLVMDALEVLRGYKEGTDRNIVSQKIFGDGVKVSSELLTLNAKKLGEAKEKADELGLAVGKDDVEAAERLRAAQNDLNDMFDAAKRMIGEALIPVLLDLGNFFSQVGPTALLAFKIALDIVISLFQGLALAVKVVWEVVKAAFAGMVLSAKGFASVFTALFRGDFAGAKAAAQEFSSGIQSNIGDAFHNIIADATKTGDALGSMWGKVINGPGPVEDSGVESPGTGDAPEDPKKDRGGAAAARRAEAEERRRLKAEFDAKMEAYRGEEKAAGDHWDVIIEIQRKELAEAIKLYGEDSKQAIAAQNRIEESKRQQAEQAARLAQLQADSLRDAKLQEIDIEERHAQALEQGGAITHQQLIELERGYEQQRYEIKYQGLLDELELNKNTVEDKAKTLADIEALEREHRAKKKEQDDQAFLAYQQEVNQQSQFLGGAIANSVNGMINRTIGLKQALGQIFATMAQQFIQTESIKLAKFIVTQGAMTGANLTGNAIRVSSDVASAAVSTAVTGATAKKSLLSTAASVFGKVYDAIAGIPYVGPFLAPVMAVAATGAVLGYVGKVASAEGGYDIPAGVNPLTQLHEKEMVLPQRQADAVRDMAEGGGAGGGPIIHFNMQAMDKRGISGFFRDNASQIVAALEQHYANR